MALNRLAHWQRRAGNPRVLTVLATVACCTALYTGFKCSSRTTKRVLNGGLMHTGIGSRGDTSASQGASPSKPDQQRPQLSLAAALTPPPSFATAEATSRPGSLPGKRVLVTGAAGFIGYHTCKALATQPDTFVLGLDNFNPHHSPAFKTLRQQRLLDSGVSIIGGDIRNATLLKELFDRYRFTQVVHLAALAGVRKSVQEPAEYVDNNVKGTVLLLEVLRQQSHPVPSLVYASSSSVYGRQSETQCSSSGSSDGRSQSDGTVGGMNGKGYRPQQGLQCCSFPTAQLHDSLQHLRRVPEQMSTPNATLSPSNSSSSSDAAFLAAVGVQPSRECSASCRMPMSVYAATKADTETLVGVYVHQYGLIATGLRFFTVYGPLGRPDMAVMAFTRKLLARQPIDILCFPLQLLQHTGCFNGSAMHQGLADLDAAKQQQHWQQSQPLPLAPLNQQARQRRNSIVASLYSAGVVQQAQDAASRRQHAVQFSVQPPPAGCIPSFRDFTAVSDVVRGIQAACDRTVAAGAASQGCNHAGRHRIYNIGAGRPHSTLMLLHHLQQLLAVQGTVRYVEAAAGTPDVWATWADTASAEHELGFKGKTELYQGLQEFVEWYWSDPVA